VVGLFNRLYQESSSDNAVEDYGLTVARMNLTPVLSGLTALGGVLIVAMALATFSGQLFSPGAAPTSSVAALDAIFNLCTNPVGMLLAGVFGLTPSLLIGALQSTAERYCDGIKSTAAPAAPKS
jgi:hypothetical protein